MNESKTDVNPVGQIDTTPGNLTKHDILMEIRCQAALHKACRQAAEMKGNWDLESYHAQKETVYLWALELIEAWRAER